MKRTPVWLRVAAVIVGLVAALAPAVLLAYDATKDAVVTKVPVATATATAASSSGSGLIDQSGSLAVAAILVVLAVGVVAGGRVLSTRRDRSNDDWRRR